MVTENVLGRVVVGCVLRVSIEMVTFLVLFSIEKAAFSIEIRSMRALVESDALRIVHGAALEVAQHGALLQ